ncbi:SOS response-associated peptidase [Micromonospora endolithica]|uniref:Abasic site processing protein n=1 Tax=Micromonospora endolithica TaxID=230091 RepID=A0A3A9YV81_9ACTN|nr:SOS response-associated peptidase [Micromonospora endolithica]RKN39932.1 SOS response-associated peptidase [Micromonospora endolithica]TWJ26089.1 putative SOS response-associated peptidase YedK [Micromonospora endolithica]
MCGRYATTRSAGDLSALFESFDDTGGRLAADHNVAPTDPVPLVRISAEGHRALCLGRWGLLPPWSRSAAGAARMINARAETVATSRAYAPSFARRRCLVPADGWYEWVRSTGGGKQAYYLTPRDGSVLAFAGIWSVWEGPAGPVTTVSVLTTAALGELAEVHDRMPLLLPAGRWAGWLAPNDRPETLLDPPPPDWLAGLEIRPVGPAVGDVRNDGPHLTARVPVPRPAVAEEVPLF